MKINFKWYNRYMKPYLQARDLLIICMMLVIAFFSIRGLMKPDTGCRDRYQTIEYQSVWTKKVVCDVSHVDSKIVPQTVGSDIIVFCSCRPIVSK